MNRRRDEDSDTGRFVFWWVVGIMAMLLVLYVSIGIARKERADEIAAQGATREEGKPPRR